MHVFSRNANRNLTYYISAEESVLKGLFTDFRKGVNINKVAGREIHNNNTLANCTRAPSSRGSDNCMPEAGWAKSARTERRHLPGWDGNLTLKKIMINCLNLMF